MAKITVSAKEILADIRAGMDDSALMEKYHLMENNLQSVFKKLLDAGILKQEELDERGEREPTIEVLDDISTDTHETDAPKPRVCPKCGKEYLDESQQFCPQDGFKLIKKDSTSTCPKCDAQVDRKAEYCGKCGAKLFQDWDYSGEDHFYQVKFHEFERNRGSFKPTWNWPAFFFGAFWYLAKGLWGKAVLMFVSWVFFILIGVPFFGAFWLVYCPIFANYDYYLLKKQNNQWW